MSIYFIPIVTLLGAALFRYRLIRALVALSRPAGSIRAFGYGYCPLGNTPSRSPYFAVAQYGLLATAIARWAIRLRGRPGVRYAYPGLYSGASSGRSISPFPNLSSAAGRCQFPHLQSSHLPVADVHSPSPFMERGSGGEVNSPSQFMERGSGGEVNDWGVRSQLRNVRSP